MHDLARDARDERRFTAIPALVVRAKPIPTPRRVRVTGLRRIDYEAGFFLRDHIHSGPGGEIVRCLSAAVQHDNQRNCLALIAAGNV